MSMFPGMSNTPDPDHVRKPSLSFGTRALIEMVRSQMTQASVELILQYSEQLDIKLDLDDLKSSAIAWLNENGVESLIYSLNALEWILPEKERVILRKSRESLDDMIKSFPNENDSESRQDYWNEVLSRTQEFQDALDIISQSSEPLSIEIFSEITLGGGTAGVATLIASGIHSYCPHIPITLTFIGENSSVNDFKLLLPHDKNVQIRTILRSQLEERAPDERATLVIGYQLTERSRSYLTNSIDAQFKILPSEQLQNPADNFLSLSMNLNSSCGALPIHPGLRTLKEGCNSLTFEQIEVGRLDWLGRNMSMDAQDNLFRQHTESAIDPCKGTWAFGYFQDAESLLAELSGLSELLRDNDSSLDFLGRNVCLHLIPGRHLYSLFSFSDLTDLGCWVVTDTDIYYPPLEEEVPLTVIVHSNIPHKELLELQYKLCVVPQRDETDSFWLRPPAIVTGNASWLEAVSADIPWKHDGYDSGERGIYSILESISRRVLFQEKPRPSLSTIKDLRDQLLAGITDAEKSWGNIEEFMRLTSKYSEEINKFNLVEDILRALALKILK